MGDGFSAVPILTGPGRPTVFVCSNEFGSHYASDGYAAILATSLICHSGGWLQRRGVRSGAGWEAGRA